MPESLPQIVIKRAICMEYGECWQEAGPYYSEHYRTKYEAAVAATKLKRSLERKRKRLSQKEPP